mmetsp:Transcript_22070/g.53428  ORF Transcript_22070/g.53428 Transcript_22070/m.53428 type:complete len:155 (-) Transcript_22070:1334-1798(-)
MRDRTCAEEKETRLPSQRLLPVPPTTTAIGSPSCRGLGPTLLCNAVIVWPKRGSGGAPRVPTGIPNIPICFELEVIEKLNRTKSFDGDEGPAVRPPKRMTALELLLLSVRPFVFKCGRMQAECPSLGPRLFADWTRNMPESDTNLDSVGPSSLS